MNEQSESEIIEEIRVTYKKTYAYIMFSMVNKLEALNVEIVDKDVRIQELEAEVERLKELCNTHGCNHQ